VIPLLDALKSGRVLLMDGAMGTELQRAGLRPDENAATWNLLHPRRVRAVHRAYLDAGAEVLLTNTFLINVEPFAVPMWMGGRPTDGRFGLWPRAYALIGPSAPYRVAAVGPVAGDPAREFDSLNRLYVQESCTNFQPHDCCHFPHAILLETCSSPRVRYALARLRPWREGPLLLSLAFHPGDRGRPVTASGHSPEWFARRARAWGADALGVNCGREIGMGEIIEIVRRYRQETDLPLFARPNAGTPRREGDRWVYPHTPEAMADRLPELLEAGACMVGGCCGTTPAHIAAFRTVVDDWNARHGRVPASTCGESA
jgi:5-methyltetrahydrofolate--homocysteine methyltransferase